MATWFSKKPPAVALSFYDAGAIAIASLPRNPTTIEQAREVLHTLLWYGKIPGSMGKTFYRVAVEKVWQSHGLKPGKECMDAVTGGKIDHVLASATPMYEADDFRFAYSITMNQ